MSRRRVDAGDRAGDEDLGAESLCLLEGAYRERFSGHTGGEAEVVLDLGRRAGLATGCLALDHDRLEALGGAVHGRGQPGGATADDHGVVLRCLGLGLDLEQLRDTAELGPHHCLPIDDPERGVVALCRQIAPPLLGLLRDVGLQPPVGDLVAVEEAAQFRAVAVPAMAEHDRSRTLGRGGEALQPAGPADAVCSQLADLLGDRRRSRGEGVVVVRLDSHHPRCLDGAEVDREDGAERDRYLAEEISRVANSDPAMDAVDYPGCLDLSLEHGEECPLVSLVSSELSRAQVDVRGSAADALAIGGVEAGEHADLPELLRRHHPCLLPRHDRKRYCNGARPSSASSAPALSRAACSPRKRRSGGLVVRSAAAR